MLCLQFDIKSTQTFHFYFIVEQSATSSCFNALNGIGNETWPVCSFGFISQLRVEIFNTFSTTVNVILCFGIFQMQLRIVEHFEFFFVQKSKKKERQKKLRV